MYMTLYDNFGASSTVQLWYLPHMQINLEVPYMQVKFSNIMQVHWDTDVI